MHRHTMFIQSTHNLRSEKIHFKDRSPVIALKSFYCKNTEQNVMKQIDVFTSVQSPIIKK